MTKTNAQAATVTKAAKAAKPASPKAAKPAKPTVDKDAIVQSSGTVGSALHFVKSVGGESLTFPTGQWRGEIRKLSAIGASFAALKAELAKAPAQLARGIASGDAPHAAKAVADQRGKPAKASNKADAATQKPAKAAKVPAASKYSGSYKWIGENAAREGTWRHAMLTCAANNTTTDAGNACLAKNKSFASHKMDWRWMAAQGYIKFG